MKMLGLALAFFALLIDSPQAQLGGGLQFPGPGMPATAGGGAYVGPGDLSITGVQAWLGIRAYSLAKAGTKAINLCDNAGANCFDENTNASGNLVVGTHGVNNCATSDTCLVKTLYDQSGSTVCAGSVPCDVTTATTANMFTLKHNCRAGTQFCLVGGSTTSLIAQAFTAALTQPFTITAVGRRTAGPTTFTNLIGDNIGSSVQMGFPNISGNAFMYAGTVVAITGVAEGNMIAENGLFNGASSNFSLNGSSNTVSAGAAGFADIAIPAAANQGAIEWHEAGFWSGDQSASFTALYGNEHTYWGF